MCIVFFFFKQKTAYEMRISDWSSDVCSSDLKQIVDAQALVPGGKVGVVAAAGAAGVGEDEDALVIVHERGRLREIGGRRPVLDGKEIGRASCRERVCQYV